MPITGAARLHTTAAWREQSQQPRSGWRVTRTPLCLHPPSNASSAAHAGCYAKDGEQIAGRAGTGITAENIQKRPKNKQEGKG